jgi:hypothetical protein
MYSSSASDSIGDKNSYGVGVFPSEKLVDFS